MSIKGVFVAIMNLFLNLFLFSSGAHANQKQDQLLEKYETLKTCVAEGYDEFQISKKHHTFSFVNLGTLYMIKDHEGSSIVLDDPKVAKKIERVQLRDMFVKILEKKSSAFKERKKKKISLETLPKDIAALESCLNFMIKYYGFTLSEFLDMLNDLSDAKPKEKTK
jgi:hypothetical protein